MLVFLGSLVEWMEGSPASREVHPSQVRKSFSPSHWSLLMLVGHEQSLVFWLQFPLRVRPLMNVAKLTWMARKMMMMMMETLMIWKRTSYDYDGYDYDHGYGCDDGCGGDDDGDDGRVNDGNGDANDASDVLTYPLYSISFPI